MWQVTACKISVSLSFLKWIKSEIIFYRISELMLPILIQRYVKNHFILIRFKNEKLTENFTGFQVPHFMIIYQFIKPFLDNKMSIFEEYGAFNMTGYIWKTLLYSTREITCVTSCSAFLKRGLL